MRSDSHMQDPRVRHPGSAMPRLRHDVRVLPQGGSEPYYLLEDPVRSKFYRIGIAEYNFASLLDGNTPIDRALAISAALPDHQGLTPEEGLAVCKWLLDHELLQGAAASRDGAGAEPQEGWSRYNPLLLRLPLVYPDRFFTCVCPLARWLFALPMVGLWLICGIAALYQVTVGWEVFAASSRQIFAWSNWLLLAAAWVLLKLVHEFGHGIVCKRYGGSVREAGLMFVLFAPLAYVDVTSSWRFQNKWQRIYTAAAGMYLEIWLASLAILLWSCGLEEWPAQLCLNLAITASLTTLLFNANPLMRFDGYYILSDGLGVPNLYTTGQQYLRYLGRRYVLGLPAALPRWPEGKGPLVRGYAIASFLWRMLICLGLIIAASTMFAGAGVLFAALALVLWFLRPWWRLVRLLAGMGEEPPPSRVRCALVAGAVTCALTLLSALPWPGAISAPALVAYRDLAVVRAGSTGFLRAIHVRDGQHVQAGQVLAVLENKDLEVEVADLALQIEQAQVTARQHEKNGHLGALQAERSRIAALQQRWSERQRELQLLTLAAPVSGQVVAHRLAERIGTRLRDGEELLCIGQEENKELKLSVAQQDIERFQSRLGNAVKVWLPGLQDLRCVLIDVSPRASLALPDEALGADRGGPLPVEPREESGEMRFLHPRFTAHVALDAEQSRRLRAGQMAIVSFSPWDESLGSRAWRAGRGWVQRQLEGAG